MSVPHPEPVRLGVLGCADIAVRRVLPAVAGHPGLRLVAVASRRRGKAAAVTEVTGGEPVEGYDRLLARADVDAVYIPLPPALHADWIERALRAGKHVLAEKPLSLRHRDTAALVALARSRGLVLLENVMFPHHRAHQQVAALLADGAIGRPQTFSSTFTVPRRAPDDIRHQAGLGGGALLDNAVYPLRAARLLLGGAWSVAGAVMRTDSRLGVDLGGSALLTRADGLAAAVGFGLNHAYTCRYEIVGSTGRIVLDRAFTPPPDHRPRLLLERDGRTETHLLEADDQCRNLLGFFVAAVRGQTDWSAAARDTVEAAALVDQVRAAAAGGSDPFPGR